MTPMEMWVSCCQLAQFFRKQLEIGILTVWGGGGNLLYKKYLKKKALKTMCRHDTWGGARELALSHQMKHMDSLFCHCCFLASLVCDSCRVVSTRSQLGVGNTCWRNQWVCSCLQRSLLIWLSGQCS